MQKSFRSVAYWLVREMAMLATKTMQSSDMRVLAQSLGCIGSMVLHFGQEVDGHSMEGSSPDCCSPVREA